MTKERRDELRETAAQFAEEAGVMFKATAGEVRALLDAADERDRAVRERDEAHRIALMNHRTATMYLRERDEARAALTTIERRLRENTDPLAALVNAHGGAPERAAYTAIYSCCIRAQGFLPEATTLAAKPAGAAS